mgnify:CR=1 FL=1
MQARNKVVESYLFLVLKVAKKYQNLGLPFPDLIQEGNIGLLKAIESFPMKKDYCFSTYAYTLINKRISRALKDMRLYASQKDLGLYVGNTTGIIKTEVKDTCLKKIKK